MDNETFDFNGERGMATHNQMHIKHLRARADVLEHLFRKNLHAVFIFAFAVHVVLATFFSKG